MRFAWIAEPPFGFAARDGRISGCDIELARHVFQRLGETFEPVETEFAELLPGLQDGRWDATVGMFITPERATRAVFTMPIWGLRDGLLVRADDVGRIDGYRSLAELGGQLAVLQGQVQRQTALRLGIAEDALVTLHDYQEAAEAVAAGKVSAYASVERAHREHIARNPGTRLSCVPVPASEKPAEPGAFACRSRDVADRMDKILREFLGTPEHAALLASFGFSPGEIAASTS
jgi:polar amino acid transport system substrate-binding protein